VIRPRKRHHKLPRLLQRPIHGHTMCSQHVRGRHRNEFVQQIRFFFEPFFHNGFHSDFEVLDVFTADAVPCFGGSSVHVIEAVQEFVFDVPAEGGEEHAYVELCVCECVCGGVCTIDNMINKFVV